MKKAKWFILNIEEVLASIFFAFMVVSIFFGVVFRYVLNDPLSWTSEVATYSFVWGIFLGVSAAMKHQLHPVIDIITPFVSLKIRKLLSIVIDLMIAVVLVYLIVLGFKFSIHAYAKLTPIMEIPYTYVDIAVPIGFMFTLFTVIRMLIDDVLVLVGKEPVFITISSQEGGTTV